MDTPETIQTRYEPLIAAAHKRDEQRHRAERDRIDFAFVDAPHLICGIPLRALTLPDYLALIAGQNAHVSKVEEPVSDKEHFWRVHNLQFMWQLTPGYPDPRCRDTLVRRIARISFVTLCGDLADYIRETFADAPRVAARPADAPAPDRDPIGVSFACHWVHQLATAYGWSRADIRAMPLKELFQHLKLLRAEERLKSGKTLLAPLDGEADRLWAAMLAEINALTVAPPIEGGTS